MVGRTARRHKLFSEAAKRWERGVDPAAAAGRDRPGGHAADHVRRRHGAVRRSSTSTTCGRARRSRSTPTCRPGGPACRTSRPGSSALLEEIGCAVDRRRRPARRSPRRPGGPTSPTRPTWSRRSSGSTATTTCRALLPVAPPGARPDRRAAPAPLGGAGAGRDRLRRGAVLPVRRSVRVATRSGCRPTTRGGSAVRLANPLSDEEPLLRTTLLPPLLATLRRNVGRGHRDLALYELGAVFLPRPGAGAPPVMGVDERPSEPSCSPPRTRWCPHSRGTSPRCWPARSNRPAGGAPGGRRPGPTRSRPRASCSPRRASPPTRVSVTAGGARAVAPGPVRRDRRRRRRRRARRRAAPGRGVGAGAAPPHRRHGARPRRGARGPGHPGTAGVRLPAGADRRGARGRPGRGRGRRGAGAGRRARASCSSRCGSSTCTPRSSWGRGASRWPTS